MPPLKQIAREAIPQALAKAERYRLLAEPREAESICRDVLAVDATHQGALVCLILALTDMFDGMEVRADEPRRLLPALRSEYEREYYAGVIEERWAKALLASGYPEHSVYELVRTAMGHFDRADGIAPAGNDDAALRWNACVRLLERTGLDQAAEEAAAEPESLDDDVPMR
jgi:hypothetical protein